MSHDQNGFHGCSHQVVCEPEHLNALPIAKTDILAMDIFVVCNNRMVDQKRWFWPLETQFYINKYVTGPHLLTDISLTIFKNIFSAEPNGQAPWVLVFNIRDNAQSA